MACLALCLTSSALFGDEPRVELGWQSAVRLGEWNTARLSTELAAPAQVHLECRALDSEGHVATFRTAGQQVPAGSLNLSVPFQVGRPDSSIELELQVDGQVAFRKVYKADEEHGWKVLTLADRVVVTAGRPRGFEKLPRPYGRPSAAGLALVELASPDELPAELAAYAAVDWVILAGSAAAPDPVVTTLQQWVQQGGRLVLALPSLATQNATAKPFDWLPLKVAAQPAVARELGMLEAFAGRNLRIPFAGRLEIPKLEIKEGVVLASSREDALFVRIPVGFGEVFVLGLDLTQPPLSSWGGLSDFIGRLISLDQHAAAEKLSGTNESVGPLTSTGISDMASQLHAAQEHFPEVQRPAPWWSMAWILGLLVVIGPLDYLLVHKILQRPHWTWITLPLWLLGLGGYAIAKGEGWNQSVQMVNQVSVIDIDTTSRELRAKSWNSIYVPQTSRLTIEVAPAQGEWAHIWPSRLDTPPLTGWTSIPETSTGGLYRSGGAEWGRTTYDIQPLSGELLNLPVLKWSARTVATQWSGMVDPAVSSDLQNTGLGRLSGEISHQLPGPLIDWMLIYGMRVYRLQVSREDENVIAFEPGKPLNTDDPRFIQGDLRSVLTRIVTSREAEEARINEQRLRREQARYDSTDRDLNLFWQILSFHRQAGGVGYTGLSNNGLPDDDLSRLLDLDRAILFGKVEVAPVSQIKIQGETITPRKNDIFIRAVLPVKRSGTIRQLPKFDKNDPKP